MLKTKYKEELYSFFHFPPTFATKKKHRQHLWSCWQVRFFLRGKGGRRNFLHKVRKFFYPPLATVLATTDALRVDLLSSFGTNNTPKFQDKKLFHLPLDSWGRLRLFKYKIQGRSVLPTFLGVLTRLRLDFFSSYETTDLLKWIGLSTWGQWNKFRSVHTIYQEPRGASQYPRNNNKITQYTLKLLSGCQNYWAWFTNLFAFCERGTIWSPCTFWGAIFVGGAN